MGTRDFPDMPVPSGRISHAVNRLFITLETHLKWRPLAYIGLYTSNTNTFRLVTKFIFQLQINIIFRTLKPTIDIAFVRLYNER